WSQDPPRPPFASAQPLSAPPGSPGRLPDRTYMPTRAATMGTEQERPLAVHDFPPHARSEDLNHSSPVNISPLPGSSPRHSPAFLGSSRPSTPAGSSKHNHPSSSGHSDDLTRRTSIASFSSANSGGSASSSAGGAQPAPPSSVASASLSSASCASCGKPMQGPVLFHLNCFKCMDCGDVAPKGKQHPLCERDYFRRLNLICAKCGMALRGSYITACNKKFHVEHFTCSLCPTLFGPQDSYYEHEGDVYCHFHYSTRFATKCAGCSTAILKQFVEINRNMRDECWHPECYMINKFWNVKVVSRRPTSTIDGEHAEPEYTPVSLKDKQVRMEQQVYRIWTVLSAFEESSAACISDMLRQVSNGQYLDAIRMAEKFILHVEVLFATIDDLEYHFYRLNMKGMSHVREAVCCVEKPWNYSQRSVAEAMSSFLDKLHLLAVQGGNPAARRIIKGHNGEDHGALVGRQLWYARRHVRVPESCAENAGESPFGGSSSKMSNRPPSDLCVKCNLTVEEDCVRLGTYQRWHSHCVQWLVVPVPKEKEPVSNGEDGANNTPKLSTARRPPANVGLFVFEVDSRKDTSAFGEVPTAVSETGAVCFLLNVALRRLYLLLKKQGVVPLSPDTATGPGHQLPPRPILESPAGRSAPSEVLSSQKTQDSTSASHPQQQAAPHAPQPQYAQQGQVPQQRSPSQPPASTSYSSRQPRRISGSCRRTRPSKGKCCDPALMIQQPRNPKLDNGITLADIPQLMEVAQAREEQRSLPRENSIPYIAELSALELAIFDLDELIEMVETKKSGFWNKLFKAGDKKNVKKKGVFGVPLELLVEREGSDSLLGATPETMRVPSFIDDVISAMRQMDMSVEGIFRKNGNIGKLKRLTEEIDRDASSLAALLKKFLRELPDPLMTFKLHRLFIATQYTMEVLFVFLKWVASFAHMDEKTGSKMDLGNLATVICPSILYSRTQDAVRDESFPAIRVTTALLENQDEYFTVPEEFLPILRDQEYFANSMELPGKEFLKKVDTYMKLKAGSGAANGRPPNPNMNIPPFNPANDGSNPRFNPPMSPSIDARLPFGTMGNSTPMSTPMSRTRNQGQGQPRAPQPQDDWVPRPPINGNATPSSRPSSYIQPRPIHDPNSN
ncbi:hypothetical protein B0H14DRAFT_2690252, partial [Mycena olivaceomarginata]